MNRDDEGGEAPRDPLVEAIRERVMAYITGAPGYEGMSLRELSRRIGMSASGVMKFATGTRPYTPTRRKLTRWYRSLAPATRDEQQREGLALLLADVPSARRAEAELRIRTLLSEYGGPPAATPRPRGRAAGGATA